MTELTKPIESADTTLAVTVLQGQGQGRAVDGQTRPSVRELLTELAALEDATRAPGTARHERRAALLREQEIIAELHRRGPAASAVG